MKILAIESSSFALLEGERIIGESVIRDARAAARDMFPAIRDLLSAAGWKPRDLQLIAVANGPGSFTGLRISVTAANVLAYAVHAKVCGVDTLRAVAIQVDAIDRPLAVVMDAGRAQVFASLWMRSANSEMTQLSPTQIVEAKDWLKDLPENALLSGPGLTLFSPTELAGRTIASSDCWAPRAATVGAAAYHDVVLRGLECNAQVVPNYYRKSAAEEKARTP